MCWCDVKKPLIHLFTTNSQETGPVLSRSDFLTESDSEAYTSGLSGPSAHPLGCVKFSTLCRINLQRSADAPCHISALVVSAIIPTTLCDAMIHVLRRHCMKVHHENYTIALHNNFIKQFISMLSSSEKAVLWWYSVTVVDIAMQYVWILVSSITKQHSWSKGLLATVWFRYFKTTEEKPGDASTELL